MSFYTHSEKLPHGRLWVVKIHIYTKYT